jgi:ubiquinone/menaquinone biosynthesis C-methylase UbiE
MDTYKETFETWNKIASLYEEIFMDLDLYNDSYDAFCALITAKNPNILELGCGPGNITRYVLSKRPDFRLLATDIAPNMIALAKKNNPSAIFKLLDARNIRTLKTKFDGIICGFCLPYLSPSDGETLIKNCGNLLHENGVLYISFMAGDPQQSGYMSGSSGDRTYFYYHRLQNIEVTLTKNNFRVEYRAAKNYTKKDGTEETHTLLIAKR